MSTIQLQVDLLHGGPASETMNQEEEWRKRQRSSQLRNNLFPDCFAAVPY